MGSAFVPWSPLAQVNQPCARITFAQNADRIQLVMRFSEMIGGLGEDLEITFHGAIGLKWMEESSYSVSDTSDDVLEKCTHEKWRGWVRPMFVSRQTPWLTSIAVLPHTKSRLHYLLISSADIVEVLAEENPSARWVPQP